MKKLIIAIVCMLSSYCIPLLATESENPITIGILVPVEVPAMKQIIAGYEATLNKTVKKPISYLVKNAQGDANIQRAILQEFNAANVSAVAPIGTSATQMAISIIRNKPIIGIAADHLKTQAKKANNPNVTGVASKVPPAARIQFIQKAIPKLKKITLIYSTDQRIFNQVNEFEKTADKNGIQVQKLMMTQLPDLYAIGKNIAPDTQAIFVFKDELVISGLNILLHKAHEKHIPVIASDDGSVAKGAAFALGASEYQTGADAAKLTAQILNGKKAGDIPVYAIKNYFVFINPKETAAQGINDKQIKSAASKLGYTVVPVNLQQA